MDNVPCRDNGSSLLREPRRGAHQPEHEQKDNQARAWKDDQVPQQRLGRPRVILLGLEHQIRSQRALRPDSWTT